MLVHTGTFFVFNGSSEWFAQGRKRHALLFIHENYTLQHFTIPPFLILHSPFMIITVDEVNNKKELLYKTKEITKMKLKKFIAMMAVTAMVAGMATGCGGSKSDAGS